MRVSSVRASFIIPLSEAHRSSDNEGSWSSSIGGYHSHGPPEGPRRVVFVRSVEALLSGKDGEARAHVMYSELLDDKGPNLPFSRRELLASAEACLMFSTSPWKTTLRSVGVEELARKLSVPSLLKECAVQYVIANQPVHLEKEIENVRQALAALGDEGELRYAEG